MGENNITYNSTYYNLYTGEIFGLTPEENRKMLLADINESLNSEAENNIKIIKNEIDKYGGKLIEFYNGCKCAVIVGAVSANDDYYYLYYDVEKNRIHGNTGCDGIYKEIEKPSSITFNTTDIDKQINKYLKERKYYEVPFTDIYTTDKWTIK